MPRLLSLIAAIALAFTAMVATVEPAAARHHHWSGHHHSHHWRHHRHRVCYWHHHHRHCHWRW